VILTLEEYRLLNPNDTDSDSALEVKLQALESGIRAYTNNNFQKRSIRFSCQVLDGKLFFNSSLIKVGDTVQISDSIYNDGVFTVVKSDSSNITLNEILEDEDWVMVTKIVYPPDLKMGVANMLRWDSENRDKIGISSETLSRHSVSYADMGGDNSLMGYPKALLGFLTPYMKARF
jgi:hypothetical protein